MGFPNTVVAGFDDFGFAKLFSIVTTANCC